MTKREISDKRSAMEQLELKERRELLKDHNEKYHALRLELYALCEASGTHKMGMCHGDMADTNMAGQWPYRCWQCGKVEWK